MPGETDNHPLQKLAVFSEKVRLAVEYGNQLQRTAERNVQSFDEASPAEGVGLAALAADTREQHRDVCVQVGQMAKDIGTERFKARLEASIDNLQTPKDPPKLLLRGGEPLDLLDARSWCASFT